MNIILTLTDDDAAEILSMLEDGPLYNSIAEQVDQHGARHQAAGRPDPSKPMH